MKTKTKKKKNTIIGIIAITMNLIAFAYKGFLGGRVGSEEMIVLVAIGIVLTIITTIRQRNAITWISIITAILSVWISFEV